MANMITFAIIEYVADTWSWVWFAWFMHQAAFLLVVVHCLRRRREPASSVLWIFIAWSFPIIGPLVYLGFGVDRVPEKSFQKYDADQKLLAERKAREDHALPLAYWRAVHEAVATEPKDDYGRTVHGALNAIIPEHHLLGGNTIEPLVTGDEAFPAMMDAIRRAKDHIHLQSFIIRNDAIGRAFMDLLAARAEEGILVRVLYDHFGSTFAHLSGFFHRYRKVPNMQVAGWTQANILKRQFQINLRNHRKSLVIDGRDAFCGGMNLHSENTARRGKEPNRDYHFRLKGPIVQELQYTFMRDWYFITDENPDELLTERYFPQIDAEGDVQIRLLNSGPASEREALVDSFFTAMVSAQRQILIVTAYFVPTRDIVRALRSVAMRDVDVKIVVPKHSNHIYAGFAGRALYDELMQSGVQVFERRPPFMHAKAMIVDDALALVGTGNMDARSLYLNYETNLVVHDERFIDQLKRIMLDDIAQSDQLELNSWRQRPTRHKLYENLSYLLMPQL